MESEGTSISIAILIYLYNLTSLTRTLLKGKQSGSLNDCSVALTCRGFSSGPVINWIITAPSKERARIEVGRDMCLTSSVVKPVDDPSELRPSSRATEGVEERGGGCAIERSVTRGERPCAATPPGCARPISGAPVQRQRRILERRGPLGARAEGARGPGALSLSRLGRRPASRSRG